MEGSAPGPAHTSIDPSKIQNGNTAQPMADVPTGDAGTQMPPPQMQHPVESVLMAEMQETRNDVRKVVALNKLATTALFVVGLVCIYYLTTKLKAKLPTDIGDINPVPKGTL